MYGLTERPRDKAVVGMSTNEKNEHDSYANFYFLELGSNVLGEMLHSIFPTLFSIPFARFHSFSISVPAVFDTVTMNYCTYSEADMVLLRIILNHVFPSPQFNSQIIFDSV